MELKDLIKAHIQASLKDTIKFCRLRAARNNDQISSAKNRFVKSLKEVQRRSPKIQKAVGDLLSSNDIDAILNTLKIVKGDLRICNRLKDTMVNEIGTVPASRIIVPTWQVLNIRKSQEQCLFRRLCEVSGENVPDIFKDEYYATVVKYLTQRMKKLKGKCKKEIYLYDKKRFASFIPVTLADDNEICLTVISNIDDASDNVLYFTLVDTIVRPRLINPIYPIPDLKSVHRVLDTMLNKFGIVTEVDVHDNRATNL